MVVNLTSLSALLLSQMITIITNTLTNSTTICDVYDGMQDKSMIDG